MTDNEIIKALHICAEHEPFEGQQYTYCGLPLQLLFKEILAFVNRKQAEIERLQEENAVLRRYMGITTESQLSQIVADTCLATNVIKAEAIKEFAERLKRISRLSAAVVDGREIHKIIDNLVQEMAGDSLCL